MGVSQDTPFTEKTLIIRKANGLVGIMVNLLLLLIKMMRICSMKEALMSFYWIEKILTLLISLLLEKILLEKMVLLKLKYTYHWDQKKLNGNLYLYLKN